MKLSELIAALEKIVKNVDPTVVLNCPMAELNCWVNENNIELKENVLVIKGGIGA